RLLTGAAHARGVRPVRPGTGTPASAIAPLTDSGGRRPIRARGRRREGTMRSLRTIVTGRPPVTVTRTATVVEAARQMKQRNVGSVLVVDGARLVGIFTERDALFRVLAAERD